MLESDNIVLHAEFQTQPKAEIPFRMIDYRLRVYRRFPDKQMRQVVIYLKSTTSERAQQTSFDLERTSHQFDVIRLWEQPTSLFLQTPGLLPFAVLSQTADRAQVLQEVAQEVANISDRRVQNNVAASTSILAGLVLEKELIQRILRRELMQESVIYRDILLEGKAEGKAEALEQVAINLLHEGLSIAVVVKVTGLSIEQIGRLQTDKPD